MRDKEEEGVNVGRAGTYWSQNTGRRGFGSDDHRRFRGEKRGERIGDDQARIQHIY